MRRFFNLLVHDPDNAFVRVSSYHIGKYDFTALWRGIPLNNQMDRRIRLFLEPGLYTDYVSNPLSWPICSARFVDILSKRAGADFQLFDAPLFDSDTGAPQPGYSIINPVSCLECLDVKESTVSHYQNGEISAVYRVAIDSSIVPKTTNMFRMSAWPFFVILSEELVGELVGKGLQGIALQNCYTIR